VNDGFRINPRRWPLKDHYPAIASKRAQVLTYSFSHFMVRDLIRTWPTAYSYFSSVVPGVIQDQLCVHDKSDKGLSQR
jgi:hypothetical protein